MLVLLGPKYRRNLARHKISSTLPTQLHLSPGVGPQSLDKISSAQGTSSRIRDNQGTQPDFMFKKKGKTNLKNKTLLGDLSQGVDPPNFLLGVPKGDDTYLPWLSMGVPNPHRDLI